MNSTFLSRANSPIPVTAAENATKASLLALFPEVGKDTYGDELCWQVSEYQGKLAVSYEYTFRRMTSAEAFQRNSSRIRLANDRLEAVAEKFKGQLLKLKLCTLAVCKKYDEDAGSDGGSAYSEYEQGIGGVVTLKA